MSTQPPSQADMGSAPVSAGKIAGLLGAFAGACALGGALIAGLAVPATAALGTATEATGDMLAELPDEVVSLEPSQQSVLRFADGSIMAHFYAENRIVVPLEDINQNMRDAIIAIEDRRFYDHHGVDAMGIARAAVNNVMGGRLEGASTLTQQYVRNSLIEAGRQAGDSDAIDSATETTVGRKLREISLALALEQRTSKDDILAGYLNIAQFGPSQYGVEAAAQHYFSVSASDLNVVQAATLAGITQSPNRWDPVRYPDAAETRRNTVLGEMLSEGYISQQEYDEAISTPVEATLVVQDTPNGCTQAGNAAYFCEYVVKDLLDNEAWGESREDRTRMLYRGGLVIDTTLDPALQQAAYDSVVARVPVGDPSGIDASAVTVEPGTGHIVAMAQNTTFSTGTDGDPAATQVNVNADQAHGGGRGFNSGSVFKVFALVEWINSGHSIYANVNQQERLYPRSSWEISCNPDLADDYEPSNLFNLRDETTTVLNATRLSTNIPFIEMANQVDLCDITENAAKMGVRNGSGEELTPNPAMILGTNDVTPLSMANAFATMSARGLYCEPIAVTGLADLSGDSYELPGSQCEQVMEESVMDQTNYALQQVVGPGGTAAQAAIGRPAAGKTGTSNAATHAWFVGYTPQYSTAVWTGHRAGNKPMLGVTVNGRRYSTVYGSSLAAPIWSSYMRQAHLGEPVEYFRQPRSFNRPPARNADRQGTYGQRTSGQYSENSSGEDD